MAAKQRPKTIIKDPAQQSALSTSVGRTSPVEAFQKENGGQKKRMATSRLSVDSSKFSAHPSGKTADALAMGCV